MDLRQVENILAIAEEQSISKAADRLFMTQSGLNQQLLKLEKELGMPLFKREKHKMIPTEAGKVYLDGSRELLEVKSNTYKRLHDLAQGDSGVISLGYSPERGAEMFTEIYPVFHTLYPKIRFKTMELRNKRVTQALANRDVDLACMLYQKGNQNAQFTYMADVSEEIVLGVPSSHPMAYLAGEDSFLHLPEVDLNVFQNDGFVLSTNDTLSYSVENEIFKTAGFRPDILYRSSGSQNRIRAVEKQFALAFFPKFYAVPNDRMVYFSVKPHITWIIGVTCRKETYLSVPELVLVDLIRKYNMRIKNFSHVK